MNFNLMFDEIPKNYDVNVSHVMELIMLAAVANLQFIKSVNLGKPKNIKEKHFKLKAKLNADYADFDKMLKSIRTSIKKISDTNDLDSSESEIDKILETILREKTHKEVQWFNKLTPIAQRDLIRKTVTSSKMKDKDKIKYSFTIDSYKREKNVNKINQTVNYLFPFDFRRLSDLKIDIYEKISVHLTNKLQKENTIWIGDFLLCFFFSQIWEPTQEPFW